MTSVATLLYLPKREELGISFSSLIFLKTTFIKETVFCSFLLIFFRESCFYNPKKYA